MEIKLSLAKIITGVVTALIIGAVLGSFALVRTSDSLVFRIVAVELDNAELKKNTMPRGELELEFKHINDRLDRAEEYLVSIDSKL
jgi:hypothetical protein